MSQTVYLLFHFLRQFVYYLLGAVELAMFVRAILSWFDPMHEWGISSFLYMVTEPIILPVRRLCERMRWFEGFPLDIPFLITFLLISLVQSLLMAL